MVWVLKFCGVLVCNWQDVGLLKRVIKANMNRIVAYSTRHKFLKPLVYLLMGSMRNAPCSVCKIKDNSCGREHGINWVRTRLIAKTADTYTPHPMPQEYKQLNMYKPKKVEIWKITSFVLR